MSKKSLKKSKKSLKKMVTKKVITINFINEEEDFGGVDIEIDVLKVHSAELKHLVTDALSEIDGIEILCAFN